MNDTNHIPPLLTPYSRSWTRSKAWAPNLSLPAICVEFKVSQIGTWAPDGHILSGQFAMRRCAPLR